MPDQPEIDYVLCDGDGNVLETVCRVDYPPTVPLLINVLIEEAQERAAQERELERRAQRALDEELAHVRRIQDARERAVERLTDRAEAAEHMREWWQERNYDRRKQRR
ncbi:MAG: hypothetical protein H6835_18475 [Planctomycetes bacterium]|nr:hypothetical protein [Planctomycetota bacterium]